MIDNYHIRWYNNKKGICDRWVNLIMTRYEAEQKAKKEYGNCQLHYKVVSEGCASAMNAQNLEKMKAALEAVGVWLNVDEGELYLSIYPERYIRTKDRNAGRRKKSAWKKEEYKKGKYELYKYSDIVLMMQSMKDQDLAEKIGMPIATFYRHKKTLKESEYYNSLDLNRLREKEYLDGVTGNYSF